MKAKTKKVCISCNTLKGLRKFPKIRMHNLTKDSEESHKAVCYRCENNAPKFAKETLQDMALRVWMLNNNADRSLHGPLPDFENSED